jgi:hypothetical protein
MLGELGSIHRIMYTYACLSNGISVDAWSPLDAHKLYANFSKINFQSESDVFWTKGVTINIVKVES